MIASGGDLPSLKSSHDGVDVDMSRCQDLELPNGDDTAIVVQTSGTTARPKTVPISHSSLLHGTRQISETLMLRPGDICLNGMPLSHMHAIAVNLLASAASGAGVLCLPGFSTGESFHRHLMEVDKFRVQA